MISRAVHPAVGAGADTQVCPYGMPSWYTLRLMFNLATPGFWDQSAYQLRCEWGPRGAAALAPLVDVVVVVDVLSFSTCVDIAVARGAVVYPAGPGLESPADMAHRLGAALVGRDVAAAYFFSPTGLLAVPAGARLVLPSPNGAALSVLTGATPTLAGCLRNARAVAAAAARLGRRVAVIAAGERWRADAHDDRSLRPAVEGLVAAGAILDRLPGSRSPEAEVAVAAFRAARGRLAAFLLACSSGRELATAGREADVALASQLNVSDFAPRLLDGAYRAAAGETP